MSVRDSERRLIDTEPNRHVLLEIPGNIFNHILHYLELPDIKNLSISSCGLLSAIENIQKWAPRLHLVAIDSAYQYKKAIRMIPEAYPGSYLTRHNERNERGQHEIVSVISSPSPLPTYAEAQMADWSCAFRHGQMRPRKLLRHLWLCPHWGCNSKDIRRIIQQHPNPLPTTYSTIPALCPFPKCSLWARHVIVATHTSPSTYEVCSSIRIYRRSCSSLEEIRNILPSEEFRYQLLRATGQLNMRMCSHYSVSSFQVLATYNFEYVLLHASQTSAGAAELSHLQGAFDKRYCLRCRLLGTYTTWGFVARYTQDSDRFWLDIEMMLCRPIINCGSQDFLGSQHWMNHSVSYLEARRYCADWDTWAETVAEDGFDWRARLPAEFMKHPSRGLLDFPLKK